MIIDDSEIALFHCCDCRLRVDFASHDLGKSEALPVFHRMRGYRDEARLEGATARQARATSNYGTQLFRPGI